MKFRYLKRVLKTLLILLVFVGLPTSLTLVSAIGRSDETPSFEALLCKLQMANLDRDLKNVLDDLAKLHVDLSRQEAHSPLSERLKTLLQEKSHALEMSITDPKTLVRAKSYVNAQILNLEKEHNRVEEKKSTDEAEARAAEEHVLRNYEPLDIKEITDKHFEGATLTPDGLFIGQLDAEALLIYDFASGKMREVYANGLSETSGFAYSKANGGELFVFPSTEVSFKTKIEVVNIKEVLNSPKTEVLDVKAKVALPINKENTKRIIEAIKADGSKSWVQDWGLFAYFQISKDGRFIATDYNASAADGTNAGGIVVYDREKDRFMAMQTPSEDLPDNRISWAISPDGKFIASRGAKAVAIYSVETGNRLDLIPADARRVSFGNQSSTIIYTEGRDQVVVTDIAGKHKKHFIVPNVIEGSARTHIHYISLSSDDSKVIASNEDGWIWVWDIKTETLLEATYLPGGSHSFTKDQDLLMTKIYSPDTRVLLWKKKQP